ncbi:MAG TPA: TolC family protein [Acidobacteriota bacterium]|nr:TolC family protein [Acidobacteriota bacterium]
MRADPHGRQLYPAVSLFLAIALLAATSASGQEPQAPTAPAGRLGLAAVLARVVDSNPLMRAHRLDVARAEVDLDQWQSFWSLPEIQLDSYSGVVPGARGDIFNSPDTSSDLNDLGPFFKGQIGFAVPVYGFGRLRHGTAAARGVVDAKASESQRARDELSKEVIRTYWGALSAGRAFAIAEDMRSSYDELVEQADQKLDEGDIDPNDVWEIRAGRYDVDAVYLETRQTERLLRDALATLMGLDSGNAYELADDGMPEVALTRAALPALQAAAMQRNPQLRALASAAGALDEAMELSESNRWPLILIGGGFGFARSSARDDQKNPFAYDEFNFTRVGAALNVRWDLNFARHSVDVARRRIERDATLARRQALQMSIEIDVIRALEGVLKNVELLEVVRDTRRETRRWLRSAGDDFDLGIGEAQPLIKAYRADYRLQQEVVKREYELMVSLAELAFVIGDLSSYLQWIADGQVVLD